MKSKRLVSICAGLLVLAVVFRLFFGGGQDPADVRNWPGSGTGPVVVLGDSLVAGTGATPQEAFPSVMAGALETEVLNAGTPGATSADLPNRTGEVLRHSPGLVVVAVGGNDLLAQTPPEAIERNLRETVRLLQEGGVPVALVGYRFGPGHWDLRGMAHRIAEDSGVWYVDNPLEDLFNDAKYKSDQIHMNAAGYRIMGERVAEEIRPLLEGR